MTQSNESEPEPNFVQVEEILQDALRFTTELHDELLQPRAANEEAIRLARQLAHVLRTRLSEAIERYRETAEQLTLRAFFQYVPAKEIKAIMGGARAGNWVSIEDIAGGSREVYESLGTFFDTLSGSALAEPVRDLFADLARLHRRSARELVDALLRLDYGPSTADTAPTGR